MSKEALVTLLAREMDRVARNTENWQERMAALGEMQRAFELLEKDPPAGTVAASLSTEVWKTLRPLKGMVQDLRSQIVKEVCALLTTVSRVTRDAMAPFLRDILPTLVEVRGSGNKVCGTYCGECLEAVVTQTVVKGATLRLFVDILLDSKNKLIRLCCISCLRRALVAWSPVMDKSDVQQLEKGLQHALYDASSSCRAQAHELFLAFHTLFPKRALVVMSMVDYKIQKRLEALVSSDVAESTKGAGSASNAMQQVQALAGFNLDVGDRVCIPDKELFGFVRFLGEIIGVKGIWVGIELDEAYGKNDGSVKGRCYFRCKPKHGVFARPHQVFLTMSGSKLHEHQLQQQQQIQDGDSFAQKSSELGVETGAVGGIEAPAAAEGPSQLSLVLNRASVAHRRYLNRLLIHVRAELEEHERFENYGATASSADAVQYLQQLQNSAQDKIVLSDEFIQQIIQAQQAARES
ncbi:CLASP N-terminal domain [Phytophthora cactorum]|nr:CLASP N-terminal domain [Phytophthora cactorum]